MKDETFECVNIGDEAVASLFQPSLLLIPLSFCPLPTHTPGKQLVRRAVAAMAAAPADEAVLEAEATNVAALAAYSSLGFLRDKRLARYYLNGADAYRLKLLLPGGVERAAGRRAGEAEAAAGLAAVGVAE